MCRFMQILAFAYETSEMYAEHCKMRFRTNQKKKKFSSFFAQAEGEVKRA